MSMKFLILPLLCLSLLSCGKEQETKMDFTYSGKDPLLLNERGSSCLGFFKNPREVNDLPPAYFKLNIPSLSWKSTTSTAQVTSIRFKINGGPFNEKIISIGSTELDVLLAFDRIFPSATKSGETLVPNTRSLLCDLVVSGLTMTNDQDVAFQAAVTGSVEGIEVDNESKDESPFQTLFYFTITNRGKNL